ncbi:MAG: hypothetical protein JGK17_10340 [Microcoleus sp. PH2017_10_PVI_O_A]|uniref:hypothetical protein n=1 Tax=unclassified Microcoleus TaxID=2642155 RepID=UPI001D80AA44|nr:MULTISPECIES: hypothetical protein [unclassified Microcoleus]MCC3405971.1 hypothetical protein [Microcoleus sp. PH2017_10_PVI_O_A]MCC3459938.1 hypothetical protein [Microcoleus sp. PH2017_11_PCY_U_A]MCC3559304.1 hypothetical protein [Microcoleus sp. PH2017_27_LUM_O_A]
MAELLSISQLSSTTNSPVQKPGSLCENLKSQILLAVISASSWEHLSLAITIF